MSGEREQRNSFRKRKSHSLITPCGQMKNSIVHPFLYDKTQKYNFFLLLSSLQWRTFFKISLAEGFHVACPIVMQKPFHKVRMEAKRSHRSAMYLSWTLYLPVYLPIDKIDWQHGIFLRGTIFSIYTIHFAESRKFDLCVDIKRRYVLTKRFPDL